MTVITLTAGTAFIMWLGERITERGIGNGISLIIFAGIVARLPSADQPAGRRCRRTRPGSSRCCARLHAPGGGRWWSTSSAGCGGSPCSTPSAWRAGRMFAGQATYFPMKVNTSGVIPPIFAGAILSFPATLGNWLPGLATVQRGAGEQRLALRRRVRPADHLLHLLLHDARPSAPDDVADNIKKQGGYIPGIRPGRQTAEYISGVLNRITFGGAHLPRRHLRHPLHPLQPCLRRAALPVRRDGAAHRRGRGAGHRAADRGAPHQPQLRGLRWFTRAAHPRSTAAGGIVVRGRFAGGSR